MSIKERLWDVCDKVGHVWMPPWAKVKRCAICGKFNKIEVGKDSIYITPSNSDILKWTASGTPSALGELGMNTSTGYPQVYINSAARALIHDAENGLWSLKASTDLGSNTTSTNLGSLTNDKGLYVLIARIKGTEANATYTIRPNSLTTDGYSTYMRVVNGAYTDYPLTDSLIVGYCNGISSYPAYTTIFMIFHGDENVSSTEMYRSYVALCGSASGAQYNGNVIQFSGGAWIDGTTDLTTIQFRSSVTNGLQIGSSFRLWKVSTGS